MVIVKRVAVRAVVIRSVVNERVVRTAVVIVVTVEGKPAVAQSNGTGQVTVVTSNGKRDARSR